MFVKLEPDASPPRDGNMAVAVAGLTAALGASALSIDGVRAVTGALAHGRSLAQSLFLFLHFFTILTNIGIAILMTISAVRLATRRPLPPARVFNAALIYILVTCVTYEIMLRHAWTPRGIQLLTDTVLHDIVPALTLAFWLVASPRADARWRDALWMLAYPAAYFAMTLVAGALGEPYPYSFLDAGRIGYRSVFVTAAVFLAIFYGLAIVTTALSKAWASRVKGDRSRVV